MLNFAILEDDIKIFMSKLLQQNTFDTFEVRNISIETIVKYEILGNINPEYLIGLENNNENDKILDNKSNQKSQERFFIKWEEIKPIISNIIKGNKKPKSMKIVLSLDDKSITTLCDNANALFLNINYSGNNNTLICNTGISQKTFSLDKREEAIWEEVVINFFKQNNINIEINN